MKQLIFLSVLLIVVTIGNAQTKENFEHINKTWAKFYKAFETLDYKVNGRNTFRRSSPYFRW